MNFNDHLDDRALDRLLRPDGLRVSQGIHLRDCPRCRRALAERVLRAGLMRPAGDAATGGHLDAKTLDALHQDTFELRQPAVLRTESLVAALRHLRHCDDCHARFFALHQKLSPSDAALAGALAAFQPTTIRKRVGTLTIRRTVDALVQQFRPVELPMPPGPVAAAMRAPERPMARESMSQFAKKLFGASRSDEARDDAPRARSPRVAESSPRSLPPSKSVPAAKSPPTLMSRPAPKSVPTPSSPPASQSPHAPQQPSSQLPSSPRSAPPSSPAPLPPEPPLSSLSVPADMAFEAFSPFAAEEMRRYDADPLAFRLDGIALELALSWEGQNGTMTIVARESRHDAPLAGTTLEALTATEHPTASATTDAEGRATLSVDQDTALLAVQRAGSDERLLIAVRVETADPFA